MLFYAKREASDPEDEVGFAPAVVFFKIDYGLYNQKSRQAHNLLAKAFVSANLSPVISHYSLANC